MSNDSSTFKEIYDRNYGLLVFYLRKMKVAEDKIPDFIQETFIRLYNNLHKVPDQNQKSFLITTARNLVVDSYRKDARRMTDLVGEDLPAHNSEMWQSDPQRDLEVNLLGTLIDKIAKEKGCESFGLFYRDGLSMQAIADKLGKPIGTIASQISRTRQKFRNEMRTSLEAIREDSYE